MTTNVIRINEQEWAIGIDRLRKTYRLYGPVKAKESCEFKELDQDDVPCFQFQNTRLSPKSIIYPQSEVMFTYSLDRNNPEHDILREVGKNTLPKAVLGIRPCDARSFQLVQKNFSTPEYEDPYWMASYTSTTMVGLACPRPCATCFCTSTGGGPFHEEGLDVLLVDDGNGFLAKILTSKGADLARTAGWHREVTESPVIEKLRNQAESSINRSVRTDQLIVKDTTALFDAPFWDEVAFACINCGTCTYSCPTCWCFDIQDEVYGKSGVRMRNWDSCMYPLFTLHGSGHNPRSAGVQRVRQRFMHKLKYFVDKFQNGIQCVGCGRCIQLCPVNIDITQICNVMNDFES